jgi:hypothetical protein
MGLNPGTLLLFSEQLPRSCRRVHTTSQIDSTLIDQTFFDLSAYLCKKTLLVAPRVADTAVFRFGGAHFPEWLPERSA